MNGKTAGSSGSEGETVTVIIPFCEEFTPREMLEAAVETAEKQEGVDVEVLVVEDEDQRGPAWARNVGLERSETRYVAFLDGDDLWEPDKLVRQLQRMAKTGAGMCVEGRPGRTTEEFIRGLLTSEIFALTSSVLIDTDRVDESLTRREDHLYIIDVADSVGVCFVDDLFEAGKYEEGMSKHVEKSPQQAAGFSNASRKRFQRSGSTSGLPVTSTSTSDDTTTRTDDTFGRSSITPDRSRTART